MHSDPRSRLATKRGCIRDSDALAIGNLPQVCIVGYSPQGGFCAPCRADDTWENWTTGRRLLLWVLAVGGGFIAILVFFFYPLCVTNLVQPPPQRAPFTVCVLCNAASRLALFPRTLTQHYYSPSRKLMQDARC